MMKLKIRALYLVVAMFATLFYLSFGLTTAYADSGTEILENTSGKEVTGLGISPIINPEYGNGNWNKVWYGSGSAPLRFNVLKSFVHR